MGKQLTLDDVIKICEKDAIIKKKETDSRVNNQERTSIDKSCNLEH